MGQMRALKIGLERRLKVKLESDEVILQWMIEHACTVINHFQVGHDGRTPYKRLMGKDSRQKFIEIGEQVLAKPKRNPTSNRKQALKSRWVHGTWVGITSRSNEHLVVLAQGGPAIRVRTVKRKPIADRWNFDEIQAIRAKDTECAGPRPKGAQM